MIIIKCQRCKQQKPENKFTVFRNRVNKQCNECRKINNLWYSQDKDSKRTKAKEYYQKTKDRVAQYRSDLRLNRKYSLTRELWKKMLTAQQNLCAICKVSFDKRLPCVDHDHKTGKVRSLLCRRCNLDLQVIENTEFITKAQDYLKSMM